MVLSFAASQLGLASLPQGVRSALSYVPTQVNKALKALANKLASVLGGGNNAGAQTGSLAPAQTFVSPAGSTTQYTLYVTQTGGTLKVQVSGPNGSVTLLTASSFSTKSAAADLDTFRGAAVQYSTATSANASALQTAYTNAANKLIADIQNNACQALGQGCFAMGTKLWTPQGYRNVEDIQPGNLVYARDENDPAAPVVARVVEEKFVRTGNVLHLHVDGQLIRTTPEHPFYVFRKGWTAAGALVAGDWISTLAGGWTAVEEVYDTGLFEAVYNLRVAEDHTYFVGEEGWGFAAWAHNAYVVKGGTGSAWRIDELDENGVTISGSSASSEPGLTVAALSAGIPNGQVRVTTTEVIQGAGGNVIATRRRRAEPVPCNDCRINSRRTQRHIWSAHPKPIKAIGGCVHGVQRVGTYIGSGERGDRDSGVAPPSMRNKKRAD